jgi:hypothetical protein|nr:MAG TPA: hypothetical protein [Caudoviricetes sp.]
MNIILKSFLIALACFVSFCIFLSLVISLTLLPKVYALIILGILLFVIIWVSVYILFEY